MSKTKRAQTPTPSQDEAETIKAQESETKKIAGAPIRFNPETSSVVRDNQTTRDLKRVTSPMTLVNAPLLSSIKTKDGNDEMTSQSVKGAIPKYAEIKEKTDQTLPKTENTASIDTNVNIRRITSDQNIDKKSMASKGESQQPLITEVKEDQKIQQATSELEYTAEAKAVDKIEPAASMLQESVSTEDETNAVIKPDNEKVLTLQDESNMRTNGRTDYDSLFMSMRSAQMYWVKLYIEFTRYVVHSSLNWFDFFYRVWLPTSTQTDKNDIE